MPESRYKVDNRFSGLERGGEEPEQCAHGSAEEEISRAGLLCWLGLHGSLYNIPYMDICLCACLHFLPLLLLLFYLWPSICCCTTELSHTLTSREHSPSPPAATAITCLMRFSSSGLFLRSLVLALSALIPNLISLALACIDFFTIIHPSYPILVCFDRRARVVSFTMRMYNTYLK